MSWEQIGMRAVVSIDSCVVGPDVRVIPEPLVPSSPLKTTCLSFSVERIYKISSRPIDAPQITDSLNKVQRAVEEKYRDICGQIFLFDDVLNKQPRRTTKIFYMRRQNVYPSVVPMRHSKLLRGSTMNKLWRILSRPRRTMMARSRLTKCWRRFAKDIDGR